MKAKYASFFMSFILALFIMAVYPYFIKQKQDGKKVIGKALLLIATGMLAALLVVAGSKYLSGKAETDTVETDIAETGNSAAEAEEQTSQEEISEENSAETLVNESDKLQIIAHRGYSSVFPENTLSAFEGAIEIGVNLIELDVQLTKDGEIVVFHDTDIRRITGLDGLVSDYTLEELRSMDMGAWFKPEFAGEKIPNLEEALRLIANSDCRVYLELKDIGLVEGYCKKVYEIADLCGMKERCIFASFQYEYLKEIKSMDASALTLYNITNYTVTLPEQFPAEYYGLYAETATADIIKAIHDMGGQAFIWTVDTPQGMSNAGKMGADGIVTNKPGLAKVAREPRYAYLTDNFESSFVMPGLYGPNRTDMDKTVVVQGLARAEGYIVISAYSKAEEYNSILYLLDGTGNWIRTIDLGFRAHVGGVSYDAEHGLLWITGAEGHVYALSWAELRDGTYAGNILVDFDAGLVNHNGSKVASFLTVDEGKLFVGSYVDGGNGVLRQYDIKEWSEPIMLSEYVIPQRIQGITFKNDVKAQKRYMLLTQGYQMDDAALLKFEYQDGITVYEEPLEYYVLPEGAEQLQMSMNGMYLLFESAALPYRATCNIPNDQVWIVRE